MQGILLATNDPSVSRYRGISADEVVDLPYGVLKIKLQDFKKCPQWVTDLEESGIIVSVPKYAAPST